MENLDPVAIAEKGKDEYAKGNHVSAAALFFQAAQAYQSAQDNLNAAEMLNNQSVALLQAGKAKEALAATERMPSSASRSWMAELSTNRAKFLTEIGHAYRLMGKPEEAVSRLEQALPLSSSALGTFDINLHLAILHSESGRLEQARAAANEVLKLSPDFSVALWGERVPYASQAQIERDMAALRRAGLE